MSSKEAFDYKEIIKREYIKCATDEKYFIKNYCYIQDVVAGKKNLFSLWDFQEDVFDEIALHRFNIVNKGRQLGISTIAAAHSLWMLLFKNDTEILVISISLKTAKNIITKVRVMHTNLPSWLKIKCIEDNKLSLGFINDSKIEAISSNTDAARSEALSLLIMDECAHIKGAKEIWTAAYPTLSTGGDALLISTPNGVGNFFHQKWVEAESELGDADFNRIKLKWDVHPQRDIEWRRKQDKRLGKKMAAQEYDASFESSGDNLISQEILNWYDTTFVCDPIEKRYNSKLRIWKNPVINQTYVVTADVGRGDSSDYSAFHVMNLDSLEQVAEYKAFIDTTDYGNMLVAIATEYNNAILIVENASIGWAVIQTILDREYDNLYYSKKGTQEAYLHIQTSLMEGTDLIAAEKLVPGFTTSKMTRPLMIKKLESGIRLKEVVLHSKRSIDELRVFAWQNGKVKALPGYNDDLAMSLAIFMWAKDNALKLRIEGEKLSKQLLNQTVKLTSGILKGQQDKVDPWKLKIDNKSTWDLRELMN